MLIQDSYNMIDFGSRLVPVVTHAHQGDNLDVFYYFNDMLGLNEAPSVYAVTPEGKRHCLDMIKSGEGHCTYRIRINDNGLYHLIAEQASYISRDSEGRCFRGTFEDNPDAVSATRSLHYAHVVLHSGESFESSARSQALMPPLCIVPDNWSSFRVGEVLAITLAFMDRPLPLYDIDIFRFTEKGEVTREQHITNGDGRMFYPLNSAGKYLLTVSYTSPEYKEELYYSTKYTYSFWFKA